MMAAAIGRRKADASRADLSLSPHESPCVWCAGTIQRVRPLMSLHLSSPLLEQPTLESHCAAMAVW